MVLAIAYAFGVLACWLCSTGMVWARLLFALLWPVTVVAIGTTALLAAVLLASNSWVGFRWPWRAR